MGIELFNTLPQKIKQLGDYAGFKTEMKA